MSTTILSVEKLQEISAISNALANQTDLLMPFVEFAEVAHLKEDILGEALYDDIIADIEAGTLSGNNQTLCEKYLYNLSAWYSYFEASPFIAYRAEAKGVTKKFSDNSQALEKNEIADWRQAILDKAMFWRNATIKFLTNNKTNYPLWRTQFYGKTETDCTGDAGYDSANGIWVG